MASPPANPPAERQRLRLHVRGIVQGIGFRPFIFNLAQRLGLTGFVSNGASGVHIEIEGPEPAITRFLASLVSEGPPLMRLTALTRESIPPCCDTTFTIHQSEHRPEAFTLVPPDVATCAACLADTRDPSNRRHNYPFTNCTNCGPRYSILFDLPYDRAQTTMAEFTLCPDCRREYDTPADRRFHAQPNACPICGPHLQLSIPGSAEPLPQASTEILDQVAAQLLAGRILAWKGLGGYQLACDASNAATVRELRHRKRRNEKPFAVMVAGLATAESLCNVSPAEAQALTGIERPIVLLDRLPQVNIAPEVTPGLHTLGLMLPCTPMHDLLFRALAARGAPHAALVMTSGNLSEEPIVIDSAAAERHLHTVADAFVHHNRRIHTRVDDSVLRIVSGAPMLLRRARGYAPLPIPLDNADAQVLACGAQQKNTFCLTRSGYALPSQHLGDLENVETLDFFEQTLHRMQHLFHVSPTAIAHDLHPTYLSTHFAQRHAAQHNLPLLPIQHHHAHIAAVMAEHALTGDVIGIAWDGTGYGTDAQIWGGEALVASLGTFTRYAHLRYVPMPGGDAAVREPWRLALSHLRDAFDIPQTAASVDTPALAGIRFLQSIRPADLRIVDTMLARRLHTIDTSSCGRLFDAVAALVGLRPSVSYEGQAAIALEAIADSAEQRAYEFAITGPGPFEPSPFEPSPFEVDMRPTIRTIVEETQHDTPAATISARFHNTLIHIILALCTRMRDELHLHRVCLSGGCFQNVRLLTGALTALRAAGFEVFIPQLMPANDGGISLGQAAIACEQLRRGL